MESNPFATGDDANNPFEDLFSNSPKAPQMMQQPQQQLEKQYGYYQQQQQLPQNHFQQQQQPLSTQHYSHQPQHVYQQPQQCYQEPQQQQYHQPQPQQPLQQQQHQWGAAAAVGDNPFDLFGQPASAGYSQSSSPSPPRTAAVAAAPSSADPLHPFGPNSGMPPQMHLQQHQQQQPQQWQHQQAPVQYQTHQPQLHHQAQPPQQQHFGNGPFDNVGGYPPGNAGYSPGRDVSGGAGRAYRGYELQQPQPRRTSAGSPPTAASFDPFDPASAAAYGSAGGAWGAVLPPTPPGGGADAAGGGGEGANSRRTPSTGGRGGEDGWPQDPWSPPLRDIGDGGPGSEDSDSDGEGDVDSSIFGPQAGHGPPNGRVVGGASSSGVSGGGSGGSSGSAEGELYEIVFEHETKLGMLLERHDEWEKGSEARQERAIVKMVVDNGPAAARGITVGSKVLAVGGQPVQGLTYQQTLELIKRAPRPLNISMARGRGADAADFGYCLYKKSMSAPRAYKAWKRRCFVLGGAVAQPHVLQLYNSKQSYDRVVIAVFQRKRIDERVKAFKLSHSFKCSAIKSRHYAGLGSPLLYFKLKSPQSKLKQIYLASTNQRELEELRTRIRKWTSDA